MIIQVMVYSKENLALIEEIKKSNETLSDYLVSYGDKLCDVYRIV